MTRIFEMRSREVLDSRGNPTVEVDVILESGALGRAIVPSGASTGEYEALELRDKDSKRYGGKGVLKAVRNVTQIIAPRLKGMNAEKQDKIDKVLLALDGTQHKSRLGANAMLGVSMAVATAMANHYRLPLYQYLGGHEAVQLPVPLMNILNGGAHADNALDIQEFMIIPVGRPTFSESLRAGVEVFHTLKGLLKSKNLATSVGDEGGFAPQLQSNEQALELILESIDKAGYRLAKDIWIGLDVAASQFCNEDGSYYLEKKTKKRNREEMIEWYEKLISEYPILSIEDGLAEQDWNGWKQLTTVIGSRVQLVGDDVFVTNPRMLKKGVQEKVANAILIKPNQIGTVTETLETLRIAKKAGYATIISHRSGESEDTFIADFSVAVGAGQIKTGSLSRTDRIAKYNRLLRIEEQLGARARYQGDEIFSFRRAFK